jgi:hypothetical protein
VKKIFFNSSVACSALAFALLGACISDDTVRSPQVRPTTEAGSSSGNPFDSGPDANDSGVPAPVPNAEDLLFLDPSSLEVGQTGAPEAWKNLGSVLGKKATPLFGSATAVPRREGHCLKFDGKSSWALGDLTVPMYDDAPFVLYAVVLNLPSTASTNQDGSIAVAFSSDSSYRPSHIYLGPALLVDTPVANGDAGVLNATKLSARIFFSTTSPAPVQIVDQVDRGIGPVVLAVESQLTSGPTAKFRLWINGTVSQWTPSSAVQFIGAGNAGNLILGRGHVSNNPASAFTGTLCHVIYSQGDIKEGSVKARSEELMREYGVK